MNRAILPASCIILALIFGACSLPQLTSTPELTTTPTASGGAAGSSAAGPTQSREPRVMNDILSGQAVFLTDRGTQFDVSATDPSAGTLIRCVAADSFAILRATDKGGAPPFKAFVVGKRSDGGPGLWEITSDNKVSLAENEDNDELGSLTPRDAHAPEHMYHRFGWVYHATAVSEDGKMIVGFAENVSGFKYGNVSIPAGTTVGIYWKVRFIPGRKHAIVLRPSVIGTWKAPLHHYRAALRYFFRRLHFLDYLKLFFADRLESYLVMATAVHYDTASGSYAVSGTDQDGNDAVATIVPSKRSDEITIEEVVVPPPPPSGYGEIIVDTFNPTGPAPGLNFDVVSLFSADTVGSAGDPWTDTTAGTLAVDGTSPSGGSNPNMTEQPYFAYIDYTPSPSLPSGTTLYVRINGYTPTTVGPYGIRILTSPSSTYTYFASQNLSDSPYEPDSVSNPVSVTLGQSLNRYLTAGDIDWVVVTLP